MATLPSYVRIFRVITVWFFIQSCGTIAAAGFEEAPQLGKGHGPVESCLTRYFDQPKDHFAFKQNQQSTTTTYKQRVMYNTDSFKPNGPIFFYLGNEADVELYIDHSGLMWENAKRFGAALVFAEHRYYGKSRLFDDNACDMSLLTTEQALADYAIVVDAFKQELGASAVIGFGGSYGGMLATVFRFQYPHLVDGVIAASAPVLAYRGLDPPYDSNGFARVVTKDAGPACAAAVKSGLKIMESLGKTKEGRDKLSQIFNVCQPLNTEEDVSSLMSWTSSYWDYMAMGNFPYPSRYVQPDGGMLPAYPVKAACRAVLKGTDAITGLAAGANLFYNATGSKKCFFNDPRPLSLLAKTKRLFGRVHRKGSPEASRPCAGDWDWQWCTEHNMPFTSGTENDMFYPSTGPFDPKGVAEECKRTWGVVPNSFWARFTYGGIDGLRKGLTNVVFSNGLLDPWSAGGVLDSAGFHPSVATILIPHGAHHIDLMFSNELDPIDVRLARTIELKHIARWISEAQKRKQQMQHVNDDNNDEIVAEIE